MSTDHQKCIILSAVGNADKPVTMKAFLKGAPAQYRERIHALHAEGYIVSRRRRNGGGWTIELSMKGKEWLLNYEKCGANGLDN